MNFFSVLELSKSPELVFGYYHFVCALVPCSLSSHYTWRHKCFNFGNLCGAPGVVVAVCGFAGWWPGLTLWFSHSFPAKPFHSGALCTSPESPIVIFLANCLFLCFKCIMDFIQSFYVFTLFLELLDQFLAAAPHFAGLRLCALLWFHCTCHSRLCQFSACSLAPAFLVPRYCCPMSYLCSLRWTASSWMIAFMSILSWSVLSGVFFLLRAMLSFSKNPTEGTVCMLELMFTTVYYGLCATDSLSPHPTSGSPWDHGYFGKNMHSSQW